MTVTEVDVQNSGPGIYWRTLKCATSSAYLSLCALTWRFVDGELMWRIALGSAILSFLWLLLTYLQMQRLLRTYFDVLSRLEFELPFWIGTALAAVAFIDTTFPALRVVAACLIASWFGLFFVYLKNRQEYEIQGHGPVPKGCWISPPAKVLQPGDLLLTSGRVAANLRESVGHAELVLKTQEGMKAFSSYMASGLVLNDLAQVASATARGGHYIVLRLKTPLTEEQVLKAEKIAQDMLAENAAWRKETFERRQAIIAKLPLPARVKQWLIGAVRPSGYDWLGLFMGRLAKRHWTCIGACLELFRRLGIHTGYYGTGLLGFGASLFDPIMPVRLLNDPALYLLTNADNAAACHPDFSRPP